MRPTLRTERLIIRLTPAEYAAIAELANRLATTKTGAVIFAVTKTLGNVKGAETNGEEAKND